MTAMSPIDAAQDVLRPPAKAAIFLTLTVREGAEDAVLDAISDVPGYTRAVSFREPEAGLSSVLGIGANLWDRLYRSPRPAGLHPFIPLEGAKHAAPSTPGDLFFHFRSTRPDMCFELSYQLRKRFGDAVEVADDTHAFRYFDDRDLLGFVDGTESPPTPPSSVIAALVHADQEPKWVGASYVIIQKYTHDLVSWDAISVEEQERVIGRTKLHDIEFPDDIKPSNSHVALNTIEEPDGTQRQIVRDNVAFGSVGADEYGTFFIGYSADVGVTEEMLRNMFLGKPPGNYDRILDFSTAQTGCLFFVPPVEFLEDPEKFLGEDFREQTNDSSSEEADPSDNNDTPVRTGDGSLGIGSLKA